MKKLNESSDTLKILHLTLKKKWFDMIASGEKKEEYRELKPYWDKRLDGVDFTHVKFVNGYGSSHPNMLIEFKELLIGTGNIKWGAEPYECYYIIKLGEIIGSNFKINKP